VTTDAEIYTLLLYEEMLYIDRRAALKPTAYGL